MEELKNSSGTSKNRAVTNQNEHQKYTVSRQKPRSRETKHPTTVMPCHETTGSPIQRNADSLENLLNDYIENGKYDIEGKDKRRRHPRKAISYQMVEETLLDCLNLSRNSNKMKRISHTILQYFTYVVFNQIKNNYYKNLSKMQECGCGKSHRDSTVLYLHRKYSYDFYLRHGGKETEIINATENHDEEPGGPKLSIDLDSSMQDSEDSRETFVISDLSHTVVQSRKTPKDAFLCNLPNAPPFILRMNKTILDSKTTDANDASLRKDISDDSFDYSTTLSSIIVDSSDISRKISTTVSCQESKCPGYTEMPKLNMFIDNSCPSFENPEFKKFIGRSITLIREQQDHLYEPRGCFTSSPTICLAGLTGFSNNPFKVHEADSRGPGKNSTVPSTDILYKNSKIPRMLHPGKCKVHTKFKNVQLTSAGKGCAANRNISSSSKGCSGPCPAEKKDIQINPFVKVTVSTVCPSLTNSSAPSNAKGGKEKGGKNKNANVQTPASQSSMGGDCVRGIKSDPGCYCGNEPVATTPCPVRLKEDCECIEDEEETPKDAEDDEALCYCPPGEQPLLMKKSNIECDCANRRRCEDEILIEPPKEKPNVFWALTKVSLLKDGTKNFEIIDVSPVPPGYYLMPDVNNLVLVGPQPKPSKPAPSKNCCCK